MQRQKKQTETQKDLVMNLMFHMFFCRVWQVWQILSYNLLKLTFILGVNKICRTDWMLVWQLLIKWTIDLLTWMACITIMKLIIWPKQRIQWCLLCVHAYSTNVSDQQTNPTLVRDNPIASNNCLQALDTVYHCTLRFGMGSCRLTHRTGHLCSMSYILL